jgi:hypothetical protein
MHFPAIYEAKIESKKTKKVTFYRSCSFHSLIVLRSFSFTRMAHRLSIISVIIDGRTAVLVQCVARGMMKDESSEQRVSLFYLLN